MGTGVLKLNKIESADVFASLSFLYRSDRRMAWFTMFLISADALFSKK
jgi:hypothetical protein